ncbi:PmoA family protein [Cellulosimicrobium terreum]|nr:PmoA family protein [Cellulosimicrobium terreum]
MPDARQRSAVTIADVAAAAGVSRATVSRVMNGRATVDAEISRRVRETAESLEYRPSNVARSLSLGRTNTVALVVPDLGNPLFQQILRGVTNSAAPAGYRVLVADTAEDPTEEAAIALEARLRCDALVLVSPRMPDTELAALIPRVSPVVVVNRELHGVPGVPSLVVDYAYAAEQVLDHLVDLGHRRIAYLSGPPGSASDALRRTGLARALARHRDVDLVDLPAGSDIVAGHGVVDEVLTARPTAVVAFNDLVAFGLLAGLNEAGVAVPKDMSVTGFDDIDLARYATPSLTTVAVPQSELGRHAWKELSALIDATGHPSRATRFEPRLEVRASTGPVPRTVARARAVVTPAEPAHALVPAASVPATREVRWTADGDTVVLRWGDVRLARYQQGDRIPPVHAPRSHLHPVHSLAGVPLTDSGPVDHRHHYGASMAVPDVNGTSYWGGRTFVTDVGPTLLPNHGRQVSHALLVDPVEPHLLHDAVRWHDEHGVPQLEEERRISARILDGETWVLDWRSVLRAQRGALVIGSPATNGRPGAGYGGFFWRLPIAQETSVLSAAGPGEDVAHGSTSPWVGFVQRHPTHSTTLLLVQHDEPLPWFLRAAEYPAAGPALAWDAPRTIGAGSSVETGATAVIVDRALDLDEAAELAERVR